jgi:DNA repair exonuclease SbcCD nuclease subunit
VDLLLICGDLFADPYPSMTLVEHLCNLFALCAKRGVEVLMMPGPRDPADLRWAEEAGVRLFSEPGETEVCGVKVLGIPAVPQRKGENLLRRMAASSDASIVMHYGHCVELGSSPDALHLFRRDDIEGLPCQYLALGSHHRMEILKKEGVLKAAYAGTPVGLDFSGQETGPRHVMIGELGPEGVEIMPLRLDSPELLSLEVDCTRKEPESLLKRILKSAESCQLLRISLTGTPTVRCLFLEETLRRSLKGLQWLDVRSEFEAIDLSSEEDEILYRFSETILKPDLDADPVIRHKALELGMKALLGPLEG